MDSPSFLGGNLLDLKERYGIEAPIIKDMLDNADMDLLERAFRRIMGDREMNFNEIAKTVRERYRYSGSWTRKQLHLLEEKKK